MKTRFIPGMNGSSVPWPVAKTEKVTVCPFETDTVADGPGVTRHAPDAFVWQMERDCRRLRGYCPGGVSRGVKVIVPAAPILIAAAAKNPVPFRPEIFMMPSPELVAAIDSMSGSDGPTDTRNVLSPGKLGAESVLSQMKFSGMSCVKAAVGVIAK